MKRKFWIEILSSTIAAADSVLGLCAVLHGPDVTGTHPFPWGCIAADIMEDIQAAQKANFLKSSKERKRNFPLKLFFLRLEPSFNT